MSEGSRLGRIDGSTLGLMLGWWLGETDGVIVGINEGIVDGLSEGSWLGRIDETTIWFILALDVELGTLLGTDEAFIPPPQ